MSLSLVYERPEGLSRDYLDEAIFSLNRAFGYSGIAKKSLTDTKSFLIVGK
jgi:hypothetical protein